MPSKTPKWVGKVTANSGLNVRTGPGTNYGNVKAWPLLGKGNLVDVCDTVGNWYYIRIAGKVYGYASKTYITKNGAAKKSIGKSALKSKNTKNNKNKKDNKKKLTKAQELALKKKKEAEQKKLRQQKIDAYNNKIKKKSKIGNFGETIVFSVSSSKILTPKDMKRTVSARWEQHKILGKAPKSEFVGQNAPETTMTVVLSAENGVKPRSTLGKIEKAIKAGTVNWLVIGGKFVGGRKMYISSCSETWDEIWNKGELVKATVNLTFVEYT